MTERFWYSTDQAAEYANCHQVTVRRALEAGELHGSQRRARGRWQIRRECLDAWQAGQPCEHKAAVA